MVPKNILSLSVLAVEVKFRDFENFDICLAEIKALAAFGSSQSGLVALAGAICGRCFFSFACKGR